MRRRPAPAQIRASAAIALTAILLMGCVTPRSQLPPEEIARQQKVIETLAADRPETLRPLYAAVVEGGERDAVLNWLTLGRTALIQGHRDAAADAFDEALKRIAAVYADEPQAEKARSVWHKESVKDFKGEPYERAMAYVYRGILDMLAGDYENARASFRGAILQDSFAEQERHRQDFASASWLIGWTSRCLGDTSAAAEAFTEARELRPKLPLPGDEDGLLVIAEAGHGPIKETAGQHGFKLAYREGIAPAYRYAAALGDQSRPLELAEDLYMQAVTRGGRQMDDILALKADTKTTTDAIGTGATAVGAGMMLHGQGSGNQNVATAGLVVALIGLAAQAAAAEMEAQADTRYWGTLPHSLYLAPLPLPNEQAPEGLQLRFIGAGPNEVANAVRPGTTPQIARHGACALAWYPQSAVRAQPARMREPAESVPEETPDREETSRGNCRTTDGTLANLPPNVCAVINGTVLSLVPDT